MPPPGQSGRPGATSIAALRAELEEDVNRLEGENGEIDLLMRQVLVEIERHQSRLGKAEERLKSLEGLASSDQAELSEVRASVLALTRREMLYDAQRQVLEGKQRGLARFLQRIVEIDNSLAAMAGTQVRPAPVATAGMRALAAAAGGGAPGLSQPAMQMRSQEDLRREIARQLHDGPAQSIANIGLQAEIVERLVEKRDERAADELEALRRLVQQALDATKAFIFEIRPMVLDDLGLVPTVRRAAADRGERSGIDIEFDSQGIEDRLDPDIESAVFRCIDEAIAGYIDLVPPSIVVRMEWSRHELASTVEGTWPRQASTESGESEIQRRPGETPPVLLAMMEEKRSQDRDATVASRALDPERVQRISARARALGLAFTMREEGQVMELIAPISRDGPA